MSWSRSYTGTAEEVIEAAKAEREKIEATLPEFERGDVQHVISAADVAVKAAPEGANISLSISGHGWRDSTTGGAGGAVSVSVSYSLVAAVQPAAAAAE